MTGDKSPGTIYNDINNERGGETFVAVPLSPPPKKQTNKQYLHVKLHVYMDVMMLSSNHTGCRHQRTNDREEERTYC